MEVPEGSNLIIVIADYCHVVLSHVVVHVCSVCLVLASDIRTFLDLLKVNGTWSINSEVDTASTESEEL
jgi:hypothetical protein